MPADNIEIVRRLMEAYETGDVDAQTVSEGKVARVEFFTSKDPTLRPAGLTEFRIEREQAG